MIYFMDEINMTIDKVFEQCNKNKSASENRFEAWLTDGKPGGALLMLTDYARGTNDEWIHCEHGSLCRTCPNQ